MNSPFPSESAFSQEHNPDQMQLFDPDQITASSKREFTDEQILYMIVALNDAKAELEDQIGDNWISEATHFIDEALGILDG